MRLQKKYIHRTTRAATNVVLCSMYILQTEISKKKTLHLGKLKSKA